MVLYRTVCWTYNWTTVVGDDSELLVNTENSSAVAFEDPALFTNDLTHLFLTFRSLAHQERSQEKQR